MMLLMDQMSEVENTTKHMLRDISKLKSGGLAY